eukprot:4659258-Amphidinium_carterae.5
MSPLALAQKGNKQEHASVLLSSAAVSRKSLLPFLHTFICCIEQDTGTHYRHGHHGVQISHTSSDCA